MKTIKFKPYSPTSYLPAGLKVTAKIPDRELRFICDLLFKEVRRLELQAEHHQKIITSQAVEIERLVAVNRGQRDALFGRSSEKFDLPDVVDELPQSEQPNPDPADELSQIAQNDPGSVAIAARENRRGAKRGHKGYGRKIPDIPEEEIVHEIPAEQALCLQCGKPHADTGLTEDSYEIDIEIKVRRVKHKRKRAVHTCNCPGRRFIVAPKPPHVIPKGKFSHAFIAYIMVMKYIYQVPLHRLVQMFQMQGLTLTESTFIGVFKTLNDRLKPLYTKLTQINQSADHWHIDETGWKVFAPTDKKDSANWWLWVFACKRTVVYVIDASRSAAVLLEHFKAGTSGIVSSDRYSSYLKLSRLRAGIINAFCWAHLRRDFLNAGKEHPNIKAWSLVWLKKIRNIYRLNRERLAAACNHNLVAQAQAALELGVTSFFRELEGELQSTGVHKSPKQKILKNAFKNRETLFVFVHHPHVPMDNNRAERLLRLAALGRKNYYGSHAEWSANFTAICLTILQTASMNGLNAQAYLRYILDELARHPQDHPDLDLLLPWNIPERALQTYNMKSGGPPCTSTTSLETSAAGP